MDIIGKNLKATCLIKNIDVFSNLNTCNRDDVVNYRGIFLAEMLEIDRCQIQYSGDNMEDEMYPELKDGEKRTVFITHDESTFYCCEGKPLMWMEVSQLLILSFLLPLI